MSYDSPMLSIEESRALLHAIFPRYPDMRGMKIVPDLKTFLQDLRAGGSPQGETRTPASPDPLRRAG
jgi:hypothetical protein